MSTSEQLFERARRHIPGGVNSPVRAFKAVGGTPVFIDRSDGAYVFDCEGKRYIDYVLSWGPMIMGHNHPEVREAVIRQCAKGLSFGAPTELEIELAERLCAIMPGMDMVRMVSSGTEATMSAIRLARGYTGRDTIVKFEGCYHGHSDSLLVKAGSGALTLGVPSSPGVPAALADLTLTLTYNDLDGGQRRVRRTRRAYRLRHRRTGGRQYELHTARPRLPEALRKVCTDSGAVLILDEVMTGFRFGLAGRPGLLRHRGRPDHPGQGHRRRHAGGRLRRQARHHGADRPTGPGVPGGHPVGQPHRHGRRPGDAGYYLPPRFLRARCSSAPYSCAKACRTPRRRRACPSPPTTPAPCSAAFSPRRAALPVTTRSWPVISRPSTGFSTVMLEQGVYLAPASYEAGFMSSAHSDWRHCRHRCDGSRAMAGL